MRRSLIVLVACGAASTTPKTATTPSKNDVTRKGMTASKRESRLPLDPIETLTQSREQAAWIEPGPAQLVLGGTSLQAIDETPLAVDLLEERGSDVRIGVRLPHVRFAVWTARSRMHAVLVRDMVVNSGPFAEAYARGAPSAVLKAGAHVQVLARESGFAQVRYLGAVQVEGWLPDDALGDEGPADHKHGSRISSHQRTLLVTPGATIRRDARWSSLSLAIARHSMFFEQEGSVSKDGWGRAQYHDHDIWVHGYLSKRDPPSRYQPPPKAEPSVAITTNATVAADTCLYASGEPIGFVVDDRPALLESSPSVGWFDVILDTPWGPVAFEARGPTESTLEKCPAP
jgi:hypothetical protein